MTKGAPIETINDEFLYETNDTGLLRTSVDRETPIINSARYYITSCKHPAASC